MLWCGLDVSPTSLELSGTTWLSDIPYYSPYFGGCLKLLAPLFEVCLKLVPPPANVLRPLFHTFLTTISYKSQAVEGYENTVCFDLITSGPDCIPSSSVQSRRF